MTRRPVVALLTVAFVYTIAITLVLLFWPVYEGVTYYSHGPVATQHYSKTLIGQNGLWVIGLLLIPLVIVGTPLFAAWRSKRALGKPALWSAALVLTGLCLLAILSVGVFYIPAAIVLIAAATLNLRKPAGGATARAAPTASPGSPRTP